MEFGTKSVLDLMLALDKLLRDFILNTLTTGMATRSSRKVMEEGSPVVRILPLSLVRDV